jgi:maleylacetate reductase
VDPFVYEQQASRIIFGLGSRKQLAAEVQRLATSRVFLISDSSVSDVAQEAASLLGSMVAATWTEVVQHVPLDLAERARLAVDQSGADVVVCIGGGSSTGLAKAIALSHRLPIIAIPTTYAGSEQTTIYGMTGGRHKATGKDPIVLPRVVLYDPELTVGLPPHVTGPSAFNALAHSVEALYATGANPVTSALAYEAVRAINRHLPSAMSNGGDLEARSGVLYGAYLSGMALGATSAGFHHKICHVLGGTFNLVHADAHSVILPHAVAFNQPILPTEMARLAEALGQSPDNSNPAGGLWDLAVASNVPTTLKQLGLRAEDLDDATDRVMAELPPNPRPITRAEMRVILENAYVGIRPAAGS